MKRCIYVGPDRFGLHYGMTGGGMRNPVSGMHNFLKDGEFALKGVTFFYYVPTRYLYFPNL